MLSKSLNKAHILDRQSQNCVKKGLFDRAILLQQEIIDNLTCAYSETSNSRARQSITLQKTRHSANLTRLKQKVAIRDKARLEFDVKDGSEMNEAPDFSSKSTPVITTSHTSNITDKDRLIMRLQEKISILVSQLEQSQAENMRLRQHIRQLESAASPANVLSPDHLSYHHVISSDPSSDATTEFTLAPLEKPIF